MSDGTGDARRPESGPARHPDPAGGHADADAIGDGRRGPEESEERDDRPSPRPGLGARPTREGEPPAAGDERSPAGGEPSSGERPPPRPIGSWPSEREDEDLPGVDQPPG